MLAGSNKERLEQEISNLISLIGGGREVFFQLTNHSLQSSGDWVNHFQVIELFQENPSLIQLDLNIQLLYIKLASYYSLLSKPISKDLKTPRNAFAHDLNDLVFDGRIKYNFLLYKVSENFKKVMYLFYEEELGENVRSVELDLNKHINDFLTTWRDLPTPISNP